MWANTQVRIAFSAADCLRRADAQAATKEFESVISPEVLSSKYVRLAMAHLIRDSDGGDKRVHELVGEYLDDPSPFIRRFALLAECLVCSVPELERVAQRGLAKDSPKEHATVDAWGDRPCVDYLAGLIDEDELWKKTGQRGFSGTAAHFTIAMKNLARGDRAAAKHHFEACVATNKIGIFDYEWSKAYLKRMEDPTWPRWLAQNTTK